MSVDFLQMPLFRPASTWRLPRTLPNLRGIKELAIDTETKDPFLTSQGPGWHRRDGYPVGVGLAWAEGQCYLPFRHLDGQNLDEAVVLAYLKDNLRHAQTLVFANAQYDLGWLNYIGITLRNFHPEVKIADVQVAEALLDEEHPDGYSLDEIARRRLHGFAKDEDLMNEAGRAFGLTKKNSKKAWVFDKGQMWKLAPEYVGPYGERDPRITYDIWQVQKPLLEKEGLLDVLHLEQQVTPVLHKMAMQGVRVNLDAANQLNDEWKKQENTYLNKLGIGPEDIYSQDYLLRLFKQKNLPIPLTEKGNPSFKKEVVTAILESSDNPELRMFANLRELNRLRSVFVEERILGGHLRGRVFPNYVQLASDEGGTVTGRLACKNHPKQQVPKRSKLVDAKRIRALYRPNHPDAQWAKLDYSSQEPVLQIHYGMVCGFKGAAEAAAYLAQGKKLYHLIQDSCGCDYDQAKMVYLALSYNMQLPSLSRKLSMTKEEAQGQVMEPMMARCPFMKQFSDAAQARAQSVGYVRTILGRRRRFLYLEPVQIWDYRRELREQRRMGSRADHGRIAWLEKATTAMRQEEAEAFFPRGERFQRAFCHKAGNAIIQGSGADQTKMAMVAADRELRTPNSQVHDEINLDVFHPDEGAKVKEIMEHVLTLKLPVKVDCDLGPSWQ